MNRRALAPGLNSSEKTSLTQPVYLLTIRKALAHGTGRNDNRRLAPHGTHFKQLSLSSGFVLGEFASKFRPGASARRFTKSQSVISNSTSAFYQPSAEIMNIISMSPYKKYLLGFTAIAIAMSTIGCETLTTDSSASKKKKKDSSWFSFKKKEYQNPQSMTVTWSDDILTLPGKAVTRGFGGRFYFYNEKTQAIPVDGDLVVYGFDDTNNQQTSEDLSQATKCFRFTAEQLKTHFTEGELGGSYSVWIPWDQAYGAPKKIMLIPTFVTKDGRVIRGASTNLNLPGTTKNDPIEATIQQASATTTKLMPNPMLDPRHSSTPSTTSGLRTTTIQVPSNSLMRQQNFPPLLSNLTEAQNQQLSNAFSPQPNPTGTNATVQMPTMAATQPQSAFAQFPQTAPSNSNALSSIPATQSGMATKNVNGWALPEFAPADWSGLSPRSAPSQFPAPTSQVAQPSSFPIR